MTTIFSSYFYSIIEPPNKEELLNIAQKRWKQEWDQEWIDENGILQLSKQKIYGPGDDLALVIWRKLPVEDSPTVFSCD